MKLQKANGSGSRLKTLLVFVAMCAVASWCGATAYSWKPDESDPKGVLTNAVHFYNGAASVNPSVITAADYLNINLYDVASNQMLVTLPSNDVVSLPYGLCVTPKTGGEVKVDLSGAVLRQPDLAADAAVTYDDRKRLRLNASSGNVYFNYSMEKSVKHGAFMFSNVVFRLSADASKNQALDFDQGLVDCLMPNGTSRPSAYMYTFDVSAGNLPSAALRFHEGSQARLPYLQVYPGTPANEVLFDGGSSHYMYEFRLRNCLAKDTVADRTKLIVDGQNTKVKMNNFNCVVGDSGQDHRYRVSVRNGATMHVTGFARQFPRSNLTEGMEDVISLESGGRLVLDWATFNWYDACFAATNATLDSSTSSLVLDGSAAGASARLRLKNSNWLVKSVSHANTCTDSILTADGSTIRAMAANVTLIRGFTTAACGGNGLTIDSGSSVTIPQSFSDMDGATGELILTGKGTKTLSGTATTVSRIVVAGGTVVFANGAHATSELVVTNGAKVAFAGSPSDVGLAGLVLGDAASAGVLQFSSGQTLAVAGYVVVNNAKIALADDFALDSTSDLLSAGGTVSAASREAWAKAFIGSGAADGRDYTFEAVESGGGVSFRMSVVEAPARLIEQKTGTGTHAADYSFSQNARLTVAVSNDATLTVSGRLGDGGLDKVGGGKFYLTNTGNLLRGGITSKGGLFSVPSVEALGCDATADDTFLLGGGTLEFTSTEAETYPGRITVDAGSNTAAVVKNAADVTVAGVSVTTGDLVKRGPGRFVIQPAPNTTTTLSKDSGKSTGGYAPVDWAVPVDLSDDGAAPTGGFVGLNVAEGELVLKGDSSTTFRSPYCVMVGLNTSVGMVQPALVIDGAKADFASEASQTVSLGNCQANNSLAKCPMVKICNGADASLGVYCVGRYASTELYPTTIVENSTLTLRRFYGSYYNKAYHTLIAANSAVNIADFETHGPNDMDFANSVMQKYATGACIDNAKISGTYEGTWTFRSGSRLALSEFTAGGSLSPGANGLKLVFDGAIWETGGSKPTFHLYKANCFTFQTIGAGLTLPVADGNTLNVARAISGDGPLVKTGAGALVFETQGTWDSTKTTKTPMADPVSLAFAGELDVREGAVSVSSGACRQGGAYRTAAGTSVDFGGNSLGGASFAGAGTFSDFSATDATIVFNGLDAAVPTFSSATLSGVTRVDFGCSAEDPFPWREHMTLTVARFAGVAPDVSRWRAVGLGEMGASGKFEVVGDEVRVTLFLRGFRLIFR